MKKLTLAIPIMNQLHDTKGILANLRYMTSNDVEWLIIDNASTDPYETYIRRYLKPYKLNYIRNTENVGLVRSMQQAYENCGTEVLAITHNDVFLYEKDWDKRMLKYFEEIDKLGIAGFFGAQGCGPIGERIQDVPRVDVAAGMSNMLEAEIHGMRMQKEWHSAAVFDGFMMIFNMEMLKAGDGFDQRYLYHHIYDRDASLESLRRGYKNITVNVSCHHVSGITANRPEYQAWIDKQTKNENYTGDKYTHDHNSVLFEKKFKDVLPLYVQDDFSFRTGSDNRYIYKGDAIVGYEKEGNDNNSL
jgi:glycosyltransferase involved in cell wall biosynthesis